MARWKYMTPKLLSAIKNNLYQIFYIRYLIHKRTNLLYVTTAGAFQCSSA